MRLLIEWLVYILMVAALVTGILFLGFLSYTMWKAVREEVPAAVLVGTGCQGPSSIAVATEEDLMPICASIERHEIAGR